MSSFWENNKGTFKSAGIATVKGIGSGGKALGKAGYGAYKKSEAKRKGLPEPKNEEDKGDESRSNADLGISIAPVPKEQLKSLPAPPKRVAPIKPVGAGAGEYRAQHQYQQQAQPQQPQYQPQQNQQSSFQPQQNQQQSFQPQQNQQPSFQPQQNQQSSFQPQAQFQPNVQPQVQQQFQPPNDQLQQPQQYQYLQIPQNQPQPPNQMQPIQTQLMYQPQANPQPFQSQNQPTVPPTYSSESHPQNNQQLQISSPETTTSSYFGQNAPQSQQYNPQSPQSYDSNAQVTGTIPNFNRPIPPPPPPRTNTADLSSVTVNQNQASYPLLMEPQIEQPLQRVHENYVSPFPAYNPVKPPPAPKKELPDPASFAPPPRHKLAVSASKIAKNSKNTSSNAKYPSKQSVGIAPSTNLSHVPPPPRPSINANHQSNSTSISSSNDLSNSPPPPSYNEIDNTPSSPPRQSTESSIPQKTEKIPPPKPSKPAKPAKLVTGNSVENLDYVEPPNASIKKQSTWERELPPPMPARRTVSPLIGSPQANQGTSSKPPIPLNLIENNEIGNMKLSLNSRTSSNIHTDPKLDTANASHITATKKQAPPKPNKKIHIELNDKLGDNTFEESNYKSTNSNIIDDNDNKQSSTAHESLPKAAPTKPAIKPNNLQSSLFLDELNGSLNKFNLNKNDTGKPATGKPEIGMKPVVGKKPTVKKPEISAKPNVSVPQIESQQTSASIESKNSRIPTPPPPRKSVSPSVSRASNNASPVPPPPPTRNYLRPKATAPIANNDPPNIDLELSTGWFADVNSMKFPKDLTGLASSTLYSYTNEDYTRTIKVRLQDLSIIEYKFHWKKNNISSVKVEMTKFIPSPITCNVPSKNELINFHQKFGDHVASWCEHNIGKQILRGECWDLAYEALSKGCGKHAFVSTGLHHGFPILQIEAQNGGIVFINSTGQADEIRRGDILQFRSSKFYNPDDGSLQTAGMPDHTAVVVANNQGKLEVLHQNVSGKRYVIPGDFNLKNLVEGTVRVYRPAPVEWAGTL